LKKNKIAIVGPYPKPYGGISIHVQRVLAQLELNNSPYDFYNESKDSLKINNSVQFNSLISRLFGLIKIAISKYKLIHYHSPNIIGRLLFCCYGMFGKEVYIHVHGASLHDLMSKPFQKILATFFLKYVYVIADNEDIYELAVRMNPKKVFLVDAFLPPIVYLDHSEINTYKQYAEEVDLLISMVGWFSEYKEKDLYGFDITCKAINLLKNKINVRVLISVNGTQSVSIYQKFLKLLKEMQLENNIILITDDLKDVWPLLINTDIFIRPTLSDGSAVSIKEALWLDVPVLASDCVIREKECDLFNCESENDLYQKLLQFYVTKKRPRKILERVEAAKLKTFKNKLFTKIYEI
jgi:hypothetical protein